MHLLTGNPFDLSIIKAELDVIDQRMTERLHPARHTPKATLPNVFRKVKLNYQIYGTKEVSGLGQIELQGATELRTHTRIHVDVIHLMISRSGVADVCKVGTIVVCQKGVVGTTV